MCSSDLNLPNTALATFSNITVSSLTTNYVGYDFTGNFIPTPNTQYHIVLVWTGRTSAQYIYVRSTNINPYSDGRSEYRSSSIWYAWNGTVRAFNFYLYQDMINLQSYSEATIKNQGSYSLKAIAKQTNSLNDTLTKSGLSLDLSNINSIKLDVRASRTGTNIQIQLKEALGIDTEFTSNNDGIVLYGESGSYEKHAQSFQVNNNTYCPKLELYLKKVSSPTDNLIVRIETDNAGEPSGTLVDANATTNVDGSTLTTSLAYITFTFTNPFALTNSTSYWIVLSRDGSRDTSNYYRVGYNNTGGYTSGVWLYMASGSWGSFGNMDLNFKVYSEITHTKDIVISSADTWETTTWDISAIVNADKDAIDKIIFKILNADSDTTYYIDNFASIGGLLAYSEATIKVQGSYSLKVSALQTEALNKSLTKTLTDYLDYSIQDVIKFDIRASRTGSNIKLKIYDTGGTTSEYTVNILAADTWQTESWDISAITSTDRDTIEKIIIEIINADADDTIYIDNLYSKAVVEHSHVWIG